jgi:hypothetical protein
VSKYLQIIAMPSVVLSRLTDTLVTLVSRDSSVGIATAYRLDDGGVGVRVPVGQKILFSPNRPDRLQPPIQWVPGALSPGVEAAGA